MAHRPKRMGGRTALKALGAALGVGLSLVLFSGVFFKPEYSGGRFEVSPRFPVVDFFRAIPHSLPWLLPFTLLAALVLPLRALQWQKTLPREVPWRERYHLVAIGAFVHNVVPGKLGDVTRAFLMARTQGLPFATSLGSVVVAKLMEFAALMLLVGVSWLGPVRLSAPGLERSLGVAVAGSLVLVFLVTAMAHFSSPLGEALRRRARLPRLQRFLGQVSAGLGAARSLRRLIVALAYSAPIVMATALAYGIVLAGIGVERGVLAGPLVLGAITVGQTTVGVAAGTGAYYFVAAWAARSLGASAEDAAAFAALSHVGTLGTQVVLGGISVWRRKIRIRDLRKGGSLARTAAHDLGATGMSPARP